MLESMTGGLSGFVTGSGAVIRVPLANTLLNLMLCVLTPVRFPHGFLILRQKPTKRFVQMGATSAGTSFAIRRESDWTASLDTTAKQPLFLDDEISLLPI